MLTSTDETDYLRRRCSRPVTSAVAGWLAFSSAGSTIRSNTIFPSMPRPSLRRSQPLIRSFCRQHDVSYLETSLLRSYAQVTASPRRRPTVGSRGGQLTVAAPLSSWHCGPRARLAVLQ
jgi:hypothetical protein